MPTYLEIIKHAQATPHLHLIDTLEWWHRRALIGVQSVALHSTVAKPNWLVSALLPGERVLHPVLYFM